MTSKWTWMIYMAGDLASLSSAGEADIAEMRKVGSTDAVNIVVQADHVVEPNVRRFRVEREGADQPQQTLGQRDFGSPKTLRDFIEWSAETYPAERYALVLWGHGAGWTPADVDQIAKSVAAPNYSQDESRQRSTQEPLRTFFRSSLEDMLRQPSPQERAICFDDASGHSLDTVEMGKVLAGATKTLGKPFEVLGMDACLMSNFEVAYQVRPFARYLVASEESLPDFGWDYQAALKPLVANPDMAARDIAVNIVNTSVDYFARKPVAKPVTQAALDLSKAHGVADALDALAKTLTAKLPAKTQAIYSAQVKSAKFLGNQLCDIGDFAAALGKSFTDDAVDVAAECVGDLMDARADGFVVASRNIGKSVERARGVSVYLPPLSPVSKFYADLDFAKRAAWADFLRAYCG